jgi:hypothetical protein
MQATINHLSSSHQARATPAAQHNTAQDDVGQRRSPPQSPLGKVTHC